MRISGRFLVISGEFLVEDEDFWWISNRFLEDEDSW